MRDAGLPNEEQYSAHSLRRGFATESARLGASKPSIQRHGRWKTTKTVVEYIEAGNLKAARLMCYLIENKAFGTPKTDYTYNE